MEINGNILELVPLIDGALVRYILRGGNGDGRDGRVSHALADIVHHDVPQFLISAIYLFKGFSLPQPAFS